MVLVGRETGRARWNSFPVGVVRVLLPLLWAQRLTDVPVVLPSQSRSAAAGSWVDLFTDLTMLVVLCLSYPSCSFGIPDSSHLRIRSSDAASACSGVSSRAHVFEWLTMSSGTIRFPAGVVRTLFIRYPRHSTPFWSPPRSASCFSRLNSSFWCWLLGWRQTQLIFLKPQRSLRNCSPPHIVQVLCNVLRRSTTSKTAKITI